MPLIPERTDITERPENINDRNELGHLEGDLPEDFGKWNTVFKRFREWVKRDIFYHIFHALSDEPDMEYAMIDGTIIKVHRHGQGAKGELKARLSANQKVV